MFLKAFNPDWSARIIGITQNASTRGVVVLTGDHLVPQILAYFLEY